MGIRIFPNNECIIRWMDAVLLEIDKRWTNGKYYFNMSSYWHYKAEQELNTSIFDIRAGLTPGADSESILPVLLRVSSPFPLCSKGLPFGRFASLTTPTKEGTNNS